MSSWRAPLGCDDHSALTQGGRLALFSLTALLCTSLNSCGSSAPQLDPSHPVSHVGAERSAPSRPAHVSVSAVGLSSCDEELLVALDTQTSAQEVSSPTPRLTLSYVIAREDLKSPPAGLNLKRFLHRLARGPHSLSLGLSAQTQADVERAGEGRDVLLEQERDALRHALHALGWRRAQPLPKLWRPSHYQSGATPLNLTPQEWLAHDWTVTLNLTAPSTSEPPAPPLNAPLSDQLRPLRGQGGIIELPRGERCALIPRLRELQEALSAHTMKTVSLERLFRHRLEELEHPRVAMVNRPPITKGCAQLLGLTSTDDPAQQGEGRWSLIISSPGGSPTDQRRHLTLPLPHPAPGKLPSWERTPSLKSTWERRALWWGAQACVSEREESELLAPYPASTLHLHGVERRGSTPLTQLSSAHGLSHLPSLAQTTQMEQRLGVSLKWRGLLGELWPKRVALLTLDELLGFAVHRPHPEATPDAVMLISARPLRVYRLLAHLTGDHAFSTLAFHQLSFAGPILMLPSQSGWRASLQLKTSRQTLIVSATELNTTPQRAGWSLFGVAPTPFTFKLSDVQSVYGGRGRVKRALKIGGAGRAHAPPLGDLWRVDGGRLGAHRRRLNLPAGARGAIGQDRAR